MTGNACTQAPAGPAGPGKVRRLRFCAGVALVLVFSAGTMALHEIAHTPRAFELLYAAGFAGYLLVLTSRPESIGVARSAVFWVGVSVLLRLPLISVVPSDDVFRYRWEGIIQQHGYNPYRIAPDDERLSRLRDAGWERINHPDFRSVYPPAALLTFRAVTAICTFPYALKVFFILCDIGTILLLLRILRVLQLPPSRVGAYALCPLVLISFAGEGHMDSLMLLCTAGALLAYLHDRDATAGLLAGLAIATKLALLAMLPCLLIRKPRIALVAMISACVCWLPFAGSESHAWEDLRRFAATGEFCSAIGTVWRAVRSFTALSYDWIPWTRATVLAAFVVWQMMAARRARGSAGPDPTQAIGMLRRAMVVLLLCMPIVHPWYFTWIILLSPLANVTPWMAGAGLMGLCSEACAVRLQTGTWVMPEWVPQAVWSAILVAWIVPRLRRSFSRQQ